MGLAAIWRRPALCRASRGLDTNKSTQWTTWPPFGFTPMEPRFDSLVPKPAVHRREAGWGRRNVLVSFLVRKPWLTRREAVVGPIREVVLRGDGDLRSGRVRGRRSAHNKSGFASRCRDVLFNFHRERQITLFETARDVPMQHSAFKSHGMAQTVKAVCEEIRRLYQWDQVPWVIGYSGGKDSSAVLQLVWLALKELPPEKRTKPVHVISTDTLVEQPVVAAWVDASHARMRQAAAEQQMPITPHKS